MSLGAAQSSAAGGDQLSIFQAALTRGQLAEGRRVVEALERLKLPDEAAMGASELACWHENKKTIVNSLRTLSSQIYSASTRILYEIIQNADDCAFDDGDDDELRALYLECSDLSVANLNSLHVLHVYFVRCKRKIAYSEFTCK